MVLRPAATVVFYEGLAKLSLLKSQMILKTLSHLDFLLLNVRHLSFPCGLSPEEFRGSVLDTLVRRQAKYRKYFDVLDAPWGNFPFSCSLPPRERKYRKLLEFREKRYEEHRKGPNISGREQWKKYIMQLEGGGPGDILSLEAIAETYGLTIYV